MQQCTLGIDKHPLLIRGVVKVQEDPSKPARPSHIVHRNLKIKKERNLLIEPLMMLNSISVYITEA